MSNNATNHQQQKPVSNRVQEERNARRRRSDLGLSRLGVLNVANKDKDYEYRWVNDEPGRIMALTQQDDWDIVTTDMVGERSDKDRGVGQNVERVVDRATGKRAVLVRKLKTYYAEDKAKEQASLDELDAAIKRGQSSSPEGLHGPHAYVPAGGIVIDDGRKG